MAGWDWSERHLRVIRTPSDNILHWSICCLAAELLSKGASRPSAPNLCYISYIVPNIFNFFSPHARTPWLLLMVLPVPLAQLNSLWTWPQARTNNSLSNLYQPRKRQGNWILPYSLSDSSKSGLGTLLMFCLLNPQTNACEPNPKTTNSDFNRLESVTKIFCFHAISKDIWLLF